VKVIKAIEALRKLNPLSVITGWDAKTATFTVVTETTYTYMQIGNDPQIQSVIEAAAIEFDTTPDDIIRRNRRENVALARHMVMWMLRSMHLTFPKIGKVIGGRNHKCAQASVTRARELFETDKRWKWMAVRIAENAGLEIDVEKDWSTVM